MAEACRALGLPIVSGNVSLYNETPDGPILPTPVIGTVGLLEDRSRAISMAWSAGDEIWLLGEPAWDAASLAASELAWRRGRFGGQPALDLAAAVRLLSLMAELGERELLRGAHDLSVGGLAIALARLAIASAVGASVQLPTEARSMPSAAWFGERGGRVLVAVAPPSASAVAAAARATGVQALRLGVAGGETLRIASGDSGPTMSLDQLRDAWTTPF